jgi:Kdo2-lipid IVA lauroyltransferase/acyltransferase
MKLPRKYSYKLEYVLLICLEKTLTLLPRTLALKTGEFLGWCLYLSGFYKTTVKCNMIHAGFWTDDQMTRIIKQLYKNIGRYGADMLRKHRTLPPHTIHNYSFIDQQFAKGKGIIVILAHFGNWEFLATVFGEKVSKLNVVAKPMNNSIVDDWLAAKRAEASVKTIYTKQALRKMLEVLKNNEMIAILIDQHAGKHGTMVPFLGKEASTVRSVAGLVHKTGCAVLPVYSVMKDDGSYEIMFTESKPIDTEGKTEEQIITEYQIQHNNILSEWIINQPEHYFGWFHKRYRGLISYKL